MPPDTALVLAELERLPIGEALGHVHLARLAALGSFEQLTASTCLFRRGEPARELRLVLSGRISLTLEAPGQQPVIVAALSRGDMLGWSALHTDASWTASATASKASSCLRFPGAPLRELCERDRELGYCVMRHAFEVVSRRLGDCRVQLLDVFGTQ
jgi:CRP/FNR family transcriptional regulator, cyclic AMP receptor protein